VIFWQDNDIGIDHGKINIHVTNFSDDIENAKVYLFTESGSYLGEYQNTDSSGSASFTLPVKSYKLRVDYSGNQYWSEVITPLPHGELPINLALDLLSLSLTNNPKPVRFDGVPLEKRPDGIMLASIGSLTGILTQSIVAQIPEPKIYYYINDHLGTPMKVIDENNTIAWSADYKPFGEADITVDTFNNNFRFPGQYYDNETGLHYNWHRYYQPQIGRYLRPDPMGIQDGINLYLYANSNPINFFDILGLYCKIIYGDPIAGGDPIREWETQEKIGYWEAFSKKLLVEYLLSKLKVPVPNLDSYEYTIRYTTWQLLKVYIDYWNVCYDDCTDKETSREYLGKGDTGKTKEVIINQLDETARL